MLTDQTLVAVNQYPAFRSSSNFSSSSDFVPERFLANTPFPEDQMEVFEPFLLGRHKCIGQKLAWAIMRLTLARMVYAFDMEHIKGPQDFGDSLTYVSWEKKETIVGMRLCN